MPGHNGQVFGAALTMPALPAGGPYTLTVQGTNTLTVQDVLIGEVWFTSGQSNMQMSLVKNAFCKGVNNFAQEVQAANFPTIRILRVPSAVALQPLADIADPLYAYEKPATWEVVTPEVAQDVDLSAITYFFARKLQQ